MMRIVFLLLVLSGVVSADVWTNTWAPPGPDCTPTGAVWFELEHNDSRPKAFRSWVTIYANGALTVTNKRDGKQQERTRRCIAPEEMQEIEGLLKNSPWTVTSPKTCKPTSKKSTMVKVLGKTVFTEGICRGAALDAKSRKHLVKLKAKLPAKLQTECLDNEWAEGCR